MVMRKTRSEQNKVCSQNEQRDNGGDGGDGGGLVRRTWKKIMFLVFCRRVFSLACCCCCCSEEQCVCYTRHDTKQARVRYCSGSGSVTVAVWLVLGKRSSTCRSALISFTFTSFLKIQQSKGNRDTKLRSRTNHIASFSKLMRSS